MLQYLQTGVNWVLGLGATVMLPIILTIFGMILGQGFGKSFRSGLTIGIGFVGINLVVGLLFSSIGPAAQAFVTRMGIKLTILDVGWPIGAAISFGTPMASLVIVAGLALNLILIFVNATKTMDIDIWNYWHIIFSASVAYIMFDHNILLSLVVGLVVLLITLKLADWTAPVLRYHFGLPGISLPHAETVNWAPLMFLLDWVEERIPGLNKLNANPENIQKRVGLFGEPLIMGLFIGLIIGILGALDIKGVLTLAVETAAILVLMPKMVAILMEGLIPLSEGAREFLAKRFPKKQLFIGLDAAIVIGHPAGMTVALLMVPITILMAVVLPYNQMLPFADLAVLPFTMVWAVAVSRGNIVRGLINGILTMAIVFALATNFAPMLTEMGKMVGFTFPAGASMISGIDVGSHLVPWFIINLLNFKNPILILFAAIVAIVYFFIWYLMRNQVRKQYANEIAEDAKELAAKLANG